MTVSTEHLTTGPPIYRTPKGRMVLGEGPIYRASDSTLHWFDVLSSPSELYILPTDPATGLPTDAARIHQLEDSISVAAFRKNKPGSYIAAYHQGICFLDEATGAIEVVKEIIPTGERAQRRFNDGGVDARGRFWLAEIDVLATAFPPGQIPEEYGVPRGRMWRFDPDGSLHCMLENGIVCGNGVKWSNDNKTSEFVGERASERADKVQVYLNDSVGMKITSFDFDLETGSISNQRTLVDFRDAGGEPDGMVVE